MPGFTATFPNPPTMKEPSHNSATTSNLLVDLNFEPLATLPPTKTPILHQQVNLVEVMSE